LVVVKRGQGGSSSGNSDFTYDNVNDTGDAAKLAKDEERLKASGVEYDIAKGRTETSITREPDPRRVHEHR
jgi:hypothetical protein